MFVDCCSSPSPRETPGEVRGNGGGVGGREVGRGAIVRVGSEAGAHGVSEVGLMRGS